MRPHIRLFFFQCPHTMYLSSHYYTCVLILLYTNMCHHTSKHAGRRPFWPHTTPPCGTAVIQTAGSAAPACSRRTTVQYRNFCVVKKFLKRCVWTTQICRPSNVPERLLYVSSYYCVYCVCVLVLPYVSSYCNMCPHTTMYVSSYY